MGTKSRVTTSRQIWTKINYPVIKSPLLKIRPAALISKQVKFYDQKKQWMTKGTGASREQNVGKTSLKKNLKNT